VSSIAGMITYLTMASRVKTFVYTISTIRERHTQCFGVLTLEQHPPKMRPNAVFSPDIAL
jgi:hypothetical protein